MATFTQMKDVMKTCPYNPLHKVASRRLQAHIIKCSRNPDNPVMVDCPFNALHKVLPQELQQHILLCKDSRQVIREIEESRNRPATNRPVTHRSELPASADDWDQGIDENPKKYVVPGLVDDEEEDGDGKEAVFQLKSNIQVQCMLPSERKKYYRLLADKARAKELPDLKSEIRIKEEKERPSSSRSGTVSQPPDDDNPNNIRNPTTMPFRKMVGGIGRGNASLSNRYSAKSVGSSIGSEGSPEPFGRGFVKRERTDDSYNGSKRFTQT